LPHIPLVQDQPTSLEAILPRCRSASSCGRDSAAMDCRIFLSFRISRLAWRLFCPRHQGSRATWPASAWPRS
jgi:hypothetical protein